MDQFKLSVDDILYSDLTDAQLLAMLKIKALTAQLEQEPSEKQIKRFVSSKTLKNLMKEDPTLIELETNSILTQVQLVVNKRGYSKTKMRQLREKQTSVTGNLPECYGSLKEKKRKEIEKNIKKEKQNDRSLIDQEFESYWIKYPKKSGKEIARKKHLKIKRSEIDQFETAFNYYINLVKGRDNQYIKQGSTFWNNWKDIYTEMIESKQQVKSNVCKICNDKGRVEIKKGDGLITMKCDHTKDYSKFVELLKKQGAYILDGSEAV